MGNDHHESSRYGTFARNWKLIGITSKKRWRKSSTQEKILWHVLERISKSEDGGAIIRSACYETGIIDGANLQSSGDGNALGLSTIELMCLLSGIQAELIGTGKKSVLRVMNCPYSDTLGGFCSPDLVCECHLTGMVHAIDRKLRLNRRRKMCVGDPYCEFTIDSD